jgi:hypothetical protein
MIVLRDVVAQIQVLIVQMLTITLFCLLIIRFYSVCLNLQQSLLVGKGHFAHISLLLEKLLRGRLLNLLGVDRRRIYLDVLAVAFLEGVIGIFGARSWKIVARL